MFVLDTNILSEIVRREPHPNVLRRYRETPDSELFTAAVVFMVELDLSVECTGGRWEIVPHERAH